MAGVATPATLRLNTFDRSQHDEELAFSATMRANLVREPDWIDPQYLLFASRAGSDFSMAHVAVTGQVPIYVLPGKSRSRFEHSSARRKLAFKNCFKEFVVDFVLPAEVQVF